MNLLRDRRIEFICSPEANLGQSLVDIALLWVSYPEVIDVLKEDFFPDVAMVVHYRPLYVGENLSLLKDSQKIAFDMGLSHYNTELPPLEVPQTCIAVYSPARKIFAGSHRQTRDVMHGLKNDHRNLQALLGESPEFFQVIDLVDAPAYCDNLEDLF